MQKFFKIMLATILTIFTIPFGGITALADGEKVYDDIEDGEYEIGVEALETNSDEKSAADGFLINKALLKIDGSNITLETRYTKDFAMEYGINWTKLEGNNPINQHENDKAFTYVFEINEIKDAYLASMNYYVPGMPGDMGDEEKGHSVDYRIVLDKADLEELPNKSEADNGENGSDIDDEKDDGNGEGSEQEDFDQAEEKREVGTLLAEEEADAVYELNYETDSRATAGQLENPVKLLVKDDKKYVQIPIKESGAQFFRSLKFNGEEVIWNSIGEAPYVIQYKLENGIEDEIDVSMVIQAGPNVMPHDDIKLWFDKDSIKTIKEPEKQEPTAPELDPKNLSEGVYTLNYTFLEKGKDNASAMDQFTDGPAYLKVDKEGNLTIAMTFTGASMIKWFKVNDQAAKVLQKDKNSDTKIVEFVIDDLTKQHSGKVAVVVPGMYDTIHEVDLQFDTDTLEKTNDSKYPKEQGQKKPNEEPTKESKPEPKPEPKPNPKEKTKLKPTKVYEIDYIVKHDKEDRASAANDFFEKPGHILEKDGQKYLQFKVTSWSMIDWLKYNGKDVLVVSVDEKSDTALVQLKLDGDLSDVILLNMHITVPGMYSMEHDARLILDTESMEEIDASDFVIYDTPAKPSFGSNGDNGDNGEKPSGKSSDDDQPKNPKTGDTSKVFLYTMLLIGSLIPLGVQLRRRFVKA